MGIVFAEIVAVVGGHHGHAQLFFEAEKSRMDLVLLLQTLILNFKEEILFAENVTVGTSHFPRKRVFLFGEELGDFTLETAGERNESPGMFGKESLADARLVVEAME